MEHEAPTVTLTARLASWAASLLASSMVLAALILFVGASATDFLAWIRAHPVGASLLGGMLAGYICSFVCLAKIRRRCDDSGLLLWVVSGIAACVPLAVLFEWLGRSSAAFILGMAEVGAVVLHLVAIAVILARKTPPNKSLERTRAR
jgi:hypothetical protein